jgi:hypothetical protein
MFISFVVQVILFACEVNDNWTYNMAEFAKQQVQPILYAYNDLKVATKDFHPSNKLGEGGFGAIYKVNSYFNFLTNS